MSRELRYRAANRASLLWRDGTATRGSTETSMRTQLAEAIGARLDGLG